MQVPALPPVEPARQAGTDVQAVAVAAQVGAHPGRPPGLPSILPPLDLDPLVLDRPQPLQSPHGLDGPVDDLPGPAAPAPGLGGGVGQRQHPDSPIMQLHELAVVEVGEGLFVGEGVAREEGGAQSGSGLQGGLRREALQDQRRRRHLHLGQLRLHQLRQSELLHHHLRHRGERRRLESLRLQRRGRLEARRAQGAKDGLGRPALVGPQEQHVHRQRRQQAEQHAADTEGAAHRGLGRRHRDSTRSRRSVSTPAEPRRRGPPGAARCPPTTSGSLPR